MPLFTQPQLQQVAKSATPLYKSAGDVLKESIKSVVPDQQYDVFLSHRFLDADTILGLKIEIEELGYSVFVDWMVKPDLDRSRVTPETAKWLRDMMDRSTSLFYAISLSSGGSKWMPWELGYCDGKHGRVAILPILPRLASSEAFQGQEYLSLYPYVTKTNNRREAPDLWINHAPDVYVQLRRWLSGGTLKKSVWSGSDHLYTSS